jgi:hypothetical protein
MDIERMGADVRVEGDINEGRKPFSAAEPADHVIG